MTTKDIFTYPSKYGKTYPNCHFEIGTYRNGNLALSIYDEEGCITTCSVNADRVNDEFEIGIKNYSENEGMVEFLKDIGVIENDPIEIEHSGYVLIPYYKLTENGKELYK